VAGCGWLGTAIARALAARGDRVTAVRRDGGRAALLAAEGVRPLALDLASPSALDHLPRDLDGLVACQAAASRDLAAYRRAYLDANGTLISAAARAGAPLVYTGSTGVFGRSDGREVFEGSATEPDSPEAGILAAAEALVLGEGRMGRLVRLSGLYGPGRTSIIERVRSGALALGPGDGAFMNFCHLEDAVAAVLAALDRGRPGAIYHASDAQPARRREVIEFIAGCLRMAPPRTAAGAATAGEPGGRRVRGEATRAELGLALRYPSFREGLAVHLPAAR